MGLFQTSPVDGMGCPGMDVGLSAHQLVVSVDGVDKFGNCVVGCRFVFPPLRKGRQKNSRVAAADAAADLSISRPTLQRQRRSVGGLANCYLLLSAVV